VLNKEDQPFFIKASENYSSRIHLQLKPYLHTEACYGLQVWSSV